MILLTFAFSWSMAGLVPSNGPFIGMPLPRSVGRAVPSELVPGVSDRVPRAPPRVTEDGECDTAPPRAKARSGERPMVAVTKRTASAFMLKLRFAFGRERYFGACGSNTNVRERGGCQLHLARVARIVPPMLSARTVQLERCHPVKIGRVSARSGTRN